MPTCFSIELHVAFLHSVDPASSNFNWFCRAEAEISQSEATALATTILARKDGMAHGVELVACGEVCESLGENCWGSSLERFSLNYFCCLFLPCPILAAISFLMHL